MPGPPDLERGVIVQAPNLGWPDVRSATWWPTRSDAGVWTTTRTPRRRRGVGRGGRGARVLLLVTLGTGVGGGVWEDRPRVPRRPRPGGRDRPHGRESGGRACSCGKRGASGVFSAHALREQAAEIGVGDDDPRGHRSLFERYAAGDPRIVPWLGHAIDVLAQGVAHAGVLFDPDRIVFTGGLTRSWDVYRDRLVEGLLGDLGPAGPPPGGIGLSELGGRAGVVGAAGLAMKK